LPYSRKILSLHLSAEKNGLPQRNAEKIHFTGSPVPEKSPFNYTPPAAVAGCHALVMGIPCGLDGGKAYESMDDSSGYPLVI
jgi:hypothetical protein